MKPFKLPDSFLLGTATSSYQIEGNNINSSWYGWKTKNPSANKAFCDHWNNVDKDIKLMKSINSKVYRMSIEWSRIEESENVFNKKALDHYKREIKKILDAGIKPLVTLHHFSNPVWFEKKGGWADKNSTQIFLRFADYIVNALSSFVDEWVTFNEPNVYLSMGYLAGEWPPGKKLDFMKYLKAAKNIINAHRKTYRLIHGIAGKKNIKMYVGCAFHLRYFTVLNDFFINKLLLKISDYFFHDLFIKPMTKDDKTQESFSDFFGINYYTVNRFGFSLFNKKSNFPKNDLGWEINPKGLFEVTKKYFEKYKLPVFITENGICDNKDNLRIKFIYDHLFEIKKLIDTGIKIERYYHWSLLDNFEWAEDISACFGLYHVNYRTLKRTPRKSALFYAELSKHKAVTKNMILKFLSMTEFPD